MNGGLLRISSGTMNIGNANTTVVTLNNAATTLFQMDGGALTVTGGIISSATAGAGTFTMSGGTINLMTLSAGAVYTFLLGSATTFNMSGGTIIAVNGNASTDDVDIRSATQNVTGGTLQFGSATTTSANDISLINGAGGTVTLWNIVLSAGIAKNILMRSSTNVLNDVTINTLNNLSPSAGVLINVGGGNTGGNWTNNGSFTASTTTVTFTGTSAAPVIGGTAATTFNNLTINKASNNLTISTTPTVNGTLTFTNGKIVTGANRIILGTAATIATPSATSYVLGSFQKNYSAGAALAYFGGNDFPVGDATNYTPINISAGTTTTAGSLTVTTTATDHPQVTTPIASTGIDASKSANRYWTLNNSGLTVGTAVSVTATFVAGDVDAGANTANFIMQRYDGTNWNPTTLTAANALNTQASNITPLAAGNNDFAIGEPLSGFSGTLGAFNVFEVSTPANAILGRIYTKIVGTAITLNVVAVNAGRTGVNAAFSSNPITVDLLDTRNNTGAVTATTGCRSTWVTVISTQSLSPAWASGRASVTITAPANAARDARVRVTQGANVGCSTDRFSIRPIAFSSVTSNMNNSTAAGAPSLKTGQNFTINALTGLTGYDNGAGATLASPALIPLIDNTKVAGSSTAGTIGGSFTAAVSGTSTGASFFYSEVGNFGLNANAIYDNVFTSVDQGGDCTADFSNGLVGGQYGCYFGSPAVALASGFGRFIPDNFNVTFNAPQFGSTCGTFTYVGQPFTYATAAVITVTARNGTNNGLANATTTNYAGAYVKLADSATSLNQAPYATQATRYTRFDALGGGTTPALDTSLMPATTADPTIGAFVNGVGTLTFGSGGGLAFNRSTSTPNAPFNADIALTLNVIDADGVSFGGNPASFGTATAGNGIAFSSGKSFRYGRLRMQNSNGSQLIAMPIPMQTQYWNGSAFVTNTLDNCTTIAASNVAIGNAQQGLTAAMVSPPTVGGAFAAGIGSLRLPAPGGANRGSVDVSINLTAGAAGTSCTAGMPASTGSNLTHLQGLWCTLPGTYTKDPTARATFGTYRNTDKFIYQRENY
ncbi:MAG: DUF6701 domain-containing protein [Burkholderiales bacterium]